MRKPLEIVDAQLKYYNEHNLEMFSKQFHRDIEVYDLEDNKLRFKGIQEFKVRYQKTLEVAKSRAKLVNRIDLGNKIIDHEHVTRLDTTDLIEAVAIYLIEEEYITKAWFLRK